MKQTINLRDGYSKKLHDEVVSSSNLRGIVEIQVKNKDTGKIERQEKHNMIVFGGREWLLRRALGPTLSDNENNIHILNSAIRWVGVGSGGGEPGNPLQSGCTLGQDTDLYNPVRIRYPNDNNKSQLDGYYASRVLSDGTIVPGYFKQISYVSLKEDMANPYDENGITKYPKTIAEIRIELSSDDCNGANYSNLGNNVAYQDINELGLFIADDTLADPGSQQQVSSVNIIPVGTNNRINYDSGETITPPMIETNERLYWGLASGEGQVTKYYPANQSQYFDFYEKLYVDYETENYDGQFDGTKKYYEFGRKLNDKPVFIGIKNGSEYCCVDITLDSVSSGEAVYNSVKILNTADSTKDENDPDSIVETFEYQGTLENPLNSLSGDIAIITHGTIYVRYDNRVMLTDDAGIRYPVYDIVQYRNTYNQAWTNLISPHSFVTWNDETKEYESNTRSDSKQWLPIGWKFDDQMQLVEISPDAITFNLNSTIRVHETTNTVTKLTIIGMEPEESSYQVKCYVSNEDIKKVREGMKVFTDVDNTGAENTIPSESSLMVTGIYDVMNDDQVLANMQTSYFTIDRPGTTKMEYTDGLTAYVFDDKDVQAYRMFSRVCFSTIRKDQSREIIIIYKLYF